MKIQINSENSEGSDHSSGGVGGMLASITTMVNCVAEAASYNNASMIKTYSPFYGVSEDTVRFNCLRFEFAIQKLYYILSMNVSNRK